MTLTFPRRPDPTRMAVGWLMLYAVLAAQPAHAIQTRCVTTDQDLDDALRFAQTQPVEIQIVQNLYRLDNTVLLDVAPYTDFVPQPGTSLHGGYTTNCASRQIDPTTTILSDYYALRSIDVIGDLTFENITIEAALIFFMDSNGNDGYFTPGQQLLVNRSQITGDGWDIQWQVPPDLNGSVKIVDSLIVKNVGAGTDVCGIDFEVDEGAPQLILTNDTIYANQGRGICLSNTELGNGAMIMRDSIAYGNSAADVFSNSHNLDLRYNTIHTPAYPTPITNDVGNQSSDPLINDTTYHLSVAPPSPAINAGESPGSYLPATDIDGGPRVVGTRVDQGAWESSIDNSYTLTVSNAMDDVPAPAGSLRAAMQSANANGGGLITFDIDNDCGPKVIHLVQQLPAITAPVIIYGQKQHGARENTLDVGDDSIVCIILDGATHSVSNGLVVASDAPPQTVALDVHGLGFSGFTNAAVLLNGGSGHTVAGNRIGGAAGTFNLQPSGYGVSIGAGVSNVFVGGNDVANRNIIGEALNDGILVNGPSGQTLEATGISIVNNYIGVGWNITNKVYVNRGNTLKGIRVHGSDNEISGNLIGYNGGDGIDLDGASATGNVVENNDIGADDDNTDLGNASMGVRVENGGHDNKIRQNTIAQNTGTGVRIVSGLGNTIRRNRTHDNGSYGIDLGTAGIDLIDNDGAIGAQLLANRGLNYPVIGLATGINNEGVVTGALTTTSGDYIIDVYSSPGCDQSGNGEGARWLGSQVITRASAGGLPTPFRVAFALPAPQTIGFGAQLTATATDAAGNSFPGNTSEFSACLGYTNDVIFANGYN